MAEFSEESLKKIAEQKINYRYSLKIHLVGYILVNTLLLIINLFTINFDVSSINKLWVIYPVLGWFIGLCIHTVAYSLYAKGVYPMAKRGVIYHLTAFLTVMLFLVVINYATLPTYYWVLFPAIFWGIGLIAHIIIYNIYFTEKITKEGTTKSKKEKAIEKEMDKMKKKMNK